MQSTVAKARKGILRCLRLAKREEGQSFLELILMIPLYVFLFILVVQLTVAYMNVFGDFARVRNKAVKKAYKAESTRIACFQERNNHTLIHGSGSNQTMSTNVRLYTLGDGPTSCN